MSVNQSGASSRGELFGDLQLRDYLDIARRRKWWIILTATALFVAAAVVALRTPNVYRSETVIMVDPQKVPDNYVASTVSTSIADRLSTIQQQVMSPTRLKRVIDTMGLYPELRGRIGEQALIRMMQKATTIEVVQSGGYRLSTFRIAFHGKDPVMVAAVANQIAKLFIEENSRAREQQFHGTAEFLEDELRDTKKQLEQKEESLQWIKSRYILDLPESKQYHLEALTNLRTQLRTSEDRVARAQQEKVVLQSLSFNFAPAIDLDAEGQNPAASPFQVQMQKLETQLAELRARYGPNYPDVRKTQGQIDELKARMASEEQNAPAAPPVKPASRPKRNPVLQAQLQKLEEEIAAQTRIQAQLQEQSNFHLSKLERVPVLEQQIGGLMRDYDILRTHYNTLLDKKLSAEMASALESRQKGERFLILDPALVPEKPFGPNRLLITLSGLLGGLLGGIALAIVAGIADESVRNEREAAQILGKPVLAGIPHILTKQQRRWRKLRVVAALAGTVACSAVLAVLFSYVSGGIF